MKGEIVKSAKSKWIAASVTFVVLVGLMMLYTNVFSSEDAQSVYGKLSDCFFVPGALYAGFAALSWAASKGMFDSFSYIFRNFSLHSLIPGSQPRKYVSFYDYKQEKDKKGRVWYKHILFIGLIGLAVSALFLILYSM